MDYIGEHLLPGQLGHFFIVLSLVASLIATFSYFKSAQSKNDEDAAHWKKLARYAFLTEIISVVAILALTQFTVVLDFMVMSPLGDMLMKSMGLSTTQFGLCVSAYAFSAGISGLLTAGFADRFDRKKLLIFFYVGFIAGTLYCGLAQNYPQLLAARIFTGIFGG